MIFSINNISKNFGGLQALNSVTFEVEKGITALIGPNGAGKSVLLNIITLLEKKTGGSIVFEDQRIDNLHPYELISRGVARTFQVCRLFRALTVLENLVVGMHSKIQTNIYQSLLRTRSARAEERENREFALQILDSVNLADYADKLAGELPGGLQRLLELARALVSKPKILFLDEPAAGLNPQETRLLKDMLNSIRDQEVAILLVEHDMQLVMGIAEKVIVLNYGVKIAEGSPDVICADPVVIEAYLGRRYVHAKS